MQYKFFANIQKCVDSWLRVPENFYLFFLLNQKLFSRSQPEEA